MQSFTVAAAVNQREPPVMQIQSPNGHILTDCLDLACYITQPQKKRPNRTSASVTASTSGFFVRSPTCLASTVKIQQRGGWMKLEEPFLDFPGVKACCLQERQERTEVHALQKGQSTAELSSQGKEKIVQLRGARDYTSDSLLWMLWSGWESF